MIIGRILPYTHRAGAGACSPPSPPADSWARLSSSTPHADLGSPRGSSQYICQPGVTSASAAMVAATAHQIYAGFSAGHNSIIWRRAADLPGCCGWQVNSSWNLCGIEFLQSARTGGLGLEELDELVAPVTTAVSKGVAPQAHSERAAIVNNPHS